jgi:hypothetical protein
MIKVIKSCEQANGADGTLLGYGFLKTVQAVS